MNQALKDIRLDFLSLRKLGNVHLFDPCPALGLTGPDMDVDYAMELWGQDPIHPTKNGYAALAASLTSFFKDTIAQAQTARPHIGPNQPGERPGSTALRQWPRDSLPTTSYEASRRTRATTAAAQPTRAEEAAGAAPRETPSSGSAALGAAAGGGEGGGIEPSTNS